MDEKLLTSETIPAMCNKYTVSAAVQRDFQLETSYFVPVISMDRSWNDWQVDWWGQRAIYVRFSPSATFQWIRVVTIAYSTVRVHRKDCWIFQYVLISQRFFQAEFIQPRGITVFSLFCNAIWHFCENSVRKIADFPYDFWFSVLVPVQNEKSPFQSEIPCNLRLLT